MSIATASIRHRAFWSLVDQCLSSGTNFLVLFLVIVTSTTSEVGAFSLAYTSFFFILAITRGFALEPLIVRYASAPTQEWRRATSSAVGTAGALAVGIAIPVLGLALIGGGVVGSSIAATAVVLPMLIVQDSWRQAFFCGGRPRSACVNDAVFLGLQVSGYLVLAQFVGFTVFTLILVWGTAAGVAAVVGAMQVRTVPNPARSRSWYRENRKLGPAFAADYIVNRGSEQLAMVAIAGVAGLSALGAVTTARALFAPMTTVQSGLNAVAMPETARMHLSGRSQELRRLALTYGLFMGFLMLCAGAALYLLPPNVGTDLLKENWEPARRVLVAMTVFSVVNAFALGLWTGLRGMQLARPTLYARAGAGLVTVLATVAGSAYGGANGAVWGLTIGAASLSLAMAYLLFRQLRAIPECSQLLAAQSEESCDVATQRAASASSRRTRSSPSPASLARPASGPGDD